ncbi:MAG: peptide chain release factor N(5)-glutamine methyltransferase [Acidimicrobiia bacterium]|nr:peptide chain release factor N(5)-glutamine methyltransferase [Acidimicrobiia bacterium]
MTEPDPGASATISWQELAAEVADELRAGPHPLDRSEAERTGRLIAMKASGADTADWPSISAEPATIRGVAAIDSMTARRLAGEPLQYVLAEWSFRYLDLFIDRRVLIPRPETEVVAGVAIAEAKRISPDDAAILAIDLGTGSGAIGLAVAAEHAGAEVWLTDASSDALAVARANIAGIGRAGSRVRVAQGYWFDALPAELAGRIGVVVANPPYIAEGEDLPPEVVDWEPAEALIAGPEGTEDLEHLVATSPAWLAAGGSLVLELAPHQAAVVADRARELFAEVAIEPDLAGRDRLLVARRPRLR